MKKLIRKVIIGMVVIILIAYPVYASSVTRSFHPESTCFNINVTLDVDVSSNDSFYIIDEIFPESWNVTDSGKGGTTQAGHIRWFVLNGAKDTQYNYLIQSPCEPGKYTFSGEYGFDENNIYNISGEKELTISLENKITISTPYTPIKNGGGSSGNSKSVYTNLTNDTNNTDHTIKNEVLENIDELDANGSDNIVNAGKNTIEKGKKESNPSKNLVTIILTAIIISTIVFLFKRMRKHKN